MAEVLDWQGTPDQRGVIERAVQALARGQLVAFPTDTVYVVAAHTLAAEAVEHLHQLRGAPEEEPLTLAVTSAGQARDWAPDMSPLGQRLARRCWPGPVTLVFAEHLERGLVSRLPAPVRRRICPQGALGLSVPGHDALWHALRLLPGPVALAGIPRNGSARATTAAQVVQAVGKDVTLVLDGGPSRDDLTASVVRIDGNRWSVLHEGAVSAAELEQQTACVIVFVCTGNTCRSPMAEALCIRRLSERLGCKPEEMPQRGFLVLSAGLAAMTGERAAPEAAEIVKEMGGDLGSHSSRPLTAELVLQADYLFTMTQGHAAALSSRFARHGPRPRLLSPDGRDIADPIGGDAEVYRQCAQQILQHLDRLLPELHQP
jgi:tRNA threonylcarbamoyl adenosine modification protein (Sua5/YciO/YrdC/YwlC family)